MAIRDTHSWQTPMCLEGAQETTTSCYDAEICVAGGHEATYRILIIAPKIHDTHVQK